MTLTERRVLKSVEVLPTQNAVNVCWEDQILRDGEVITTANFRRAYSEAEAPQFQAEVEGAAQYAEILGWPTT